MLKFNRFRFCEARFRVFLVALVVLLSSLCMQKILLADEPEEMQTVVAMVLYTPNCDACQVVLDKVLPPIASRHNGQLEVLAVDTSLSIHENLANRLREELSVTWNDDQLPVVLVGDRILVGRTQIEAEFASLVDRYASEGGASYLPSYHPIVEEKGIPKSTGLVLIGGYLVCGLAILVLSGIAVALKSQLSKQERPPEIKADVDRTLLALIGLVGSSVDILNSCCRFLYLQDRRQDKDTTIADATGLIQNLLNTVQRVSGITPIEEYGAVVEYKSDCHTISQGRIRPGAKFRVIETGWRRGKTILSNAVVEQIK